MATVDGRLNAWSQQPTKQRGRVPAVNRRRRWEMFFPAILLSKEVVGTTANFGWIGASRCGSPLAKFGGRNGCLKDSM